MLIEKKQVVNGDSYSTVCVYECERCEMIYDESSPHTNSYCWDCSFIEGVISEKEYLQCRGVLLDNVNASIRNGKVIVWVGNTAPWDKTNKESRNTPRYKKWRESVFIRDKYTCQHCKQMGGELNAHHIKPFAKYKKLRHELDNGLTLCVDCHRKEHKKKE